MDWELHEFIRGKMPASQTKDITKTKLFIHLIIMLYKILLISLCSLVHSKQGINEESPTITPVDFITTHSPETREELFDNEHMSQQNKEDVLEAEILDDSLERQDTTFLQEDSTMILKDTPFRKENVKEKSYGDQMYAQLFTLDLKNILLPLFTTLSVVGVSVWFCCLSKKKIAVAEQLPDQVVDQMHRSPKKSPHTQDQVDTKQSLFTPLPLHGKKQQKLYQTPLAPRKDRLIQPDFEDTRKVAYSPLPMTNKTLTKSPDRLKKQTESS